MVVLSLCIREVWVRIRLCHYHDKTLADITATKRTPTLPRQNASRHYHDKTQADITTTKRSPTLPRQNARRHYHDKTHADITTTKRMPTDVNLTRLLGSTMINEVPCQISLDIKPFNDDVSKGVKNFLKRRLTTKNDI